MTYNVFCGTLNPTLLLLLSSVSAFLFLFCIFLKEILVMNAKLIMLYYFVMWVVKRRIVCHV